jgi:hypothetical protein
MRKYVAMCITPDKEGCSFRCGAKHHCFSICFCDVVVQVEQRRRERAKECFDEIRRMLPAEFDIKPDKNSILLAVIKHIEDLRVQVKLLRETKPHIPYNLSAPPPPPPQLASSAAHASIETSQSPLIECRHPRPAQSNVLY